MSIGDHVEIRRAEVQPIRKIMLEPTQRNLQLEGAGHTLLRPPDGSRGLIPDQIFRHFFEQRAFGLQEIR